MRGKARPVKIRPGEAPQHNAASRRCQPRDNVGGKGGSERAILFVAMGPENFVQGAARQPAARQGPVDRGDPKRHHAVRRRRRPLDPPNLFAKRQQRIAGH
jgi:hypothetical protein